MTTLRNAAIAWMVVAATACAGTLDNRDQFYTVDHTDGGGQDAASDGGPSCPDVPKAVFTTSCATAGCHAAANPQSGLDLASPNVATRLVGVPAASGGFLVDPAHPEQSVIYRKLKAGAPGARMPIGTPLDDATIACVLSWAQGLGAKGSINAGGPTDDAATAAPDASSSDGGRDASMGTATRVALGALMPYTDKANNLWSADVGATGGTTVVNNPPIAISKTTDPTLYNSERYGSFSYAFPMPNGSYTVTLKFAETYTAITAAGQRQFNVSLNGQQVLTNFDIFSEAGGRDTAVDKQFPVDVTNGSMALVVAPGASQSPKLDAISIVPR